MLTINRRFEIAASHRLAYSDWSSQKNESYFGKDALGRFGHGHNFEVFFAFTGPIHPKTGMIAHLTQIKEKIWDTILCHYDHVYLNEQPPFRESLPTCENLASQLLKEALTMFEQGPRPIAVHVKESFENQATACHVNSNIQWERQYTYPDSPICVTYQNALEPKKGEYIQDSVIQNAIQSYLKKQKWDPLMESRYCDFAPSLWEHLIPDIPLRRIQINMGKDRFEYFGNGEYAVTVMCDLLATHWLWNPSLSDEENKAIYGVCVNPHGHHFRLEATQKNKEVHHTRMVLQEALHQVVTPLSHTCINESMASDPRLPVTCEGWIQFLNTELEKVLKSPLYRVRLFETWNNRFTLRPTLLYR